MALSDAVKRMQRNPKLEGMRDQVLQEHGAPCLDRLESDLEEKTRRIHVGFLFDKTYGPCKTWHLLMQHLCATSQHNYKADWKAFCNLLGFDRPFIQSIENIQPSGEDPVTNTLLSLAQHRDATLSQVVRALIHMDRKDIILIISQSLIDLADGVLRDHEELSMTSMGDSGYISRNSAEDIQQDSIIIPKWLPTVPCLLKNPEQLAYAFEKVDSALIFGPSDVEGKRVHTQNNTSPCIANSKYTPSAKVKNNNNRAPVSCKPFASNIVAVQHEILARAEPNSPDPPAAANTARPKVVVMLTYASDGHQAAKTLSEALRTPRDNDERCGVLILQEQEAYLNQDPTAFVEGCYQKVHYIVPVLTPGYLRSVSPKAQPEHNTDCVDADHTRYIYTLMLKEFTNNNCMNQRVRPIIPDNMMSTVHKVIKNMPVFSAYHKLSAVDSFARKVLKQRI
ncbi:hypothetical protein B566_EDAN011505 [Ephemera danica]|nr:hypothetical protein B566_EDAN011505 [Ephemera danica]